ncbi:urease subunit beta [Bacillus sp. DTU_2020_1000418_1_SI_GHA_SEK_038]|uniref:urease subunit beta n=1 Tax=Bacillus sp. DTU_2020_1000418_1_SI_GHA_SEK_038 TaxID=3077585 RepID=UPI0028E4F32D|nr:urease subunit beta [Bacillus sp. DTU_2020_1000418_1_SI_GHA_SEK_038]WNS74960.1 urease subunit beta [Bacillus sp. DTU_2020_1000418_1_SI_GHA_SEK_038]
MLPGEYVLKDEDIIINEGKEVFIISVTNTGDRPVQVGSHFHFYEVNDALKFEREKAYGKRLNIPAGAAVRFEPGDEKEIQLIQFAGERRVYGFNNKVDGSLESEDNK